MSTQIGDLWPQLEESTTRTPSSILKEQASALARRTNGLVEADVRTAKSPDQDEIFHRFVLVAPALDNYRYELFLLAHSIMLYPLRIVADSSGVVAPKDLERAARHAKQGEGLGRQLLVGADPLTNELDNEAEFVEWLKEVFRAERTKKMIGALISQSRS